MNQEIESPPDTDELIVDALARGKSQEDAASAAGVHRSTVQRRLKDDAFRRRVSDARKGLLESAASVLAATLPEAVETLRKLMASDSERTRLDASKALLSTLLPLREQLDLLERIEQLEGRR